MHIVTTLNMDEYERIYNEARAASKRIQARGGAWAFNATYNRLVREAIARKKAAR